MSSKIKVDTIENVAGSGNVSLGSGHNLVVPGNITGQGTAAITSNATVGGTLGVTGATTLTGGVSGNTTFSNNLTVNGDATFDTNTLKVDSGNNRVAIGHTSPGTKLDIRDAGYVGLGVGSTNANGAALFLDGDSNGDFTGSDYSYIIHDSAGRLDVIQDSPSGSNQIRFFTGGTSEKMRINGDVSGQFKFNNVYVYYFLGSVNGNQSAVIDVPGVNSTGVSLVTAQYTHHNINTYGAVRMSSVSSYGGSIVNTVDIQNVSSSNNGSWTITMPSTGLLRITKTAASYVGGGYYWVKVETYYG